MRNKTFFQSFDHVSKDYYLMLVTLFFMKAGQFMILPFLAIYLTKNSNIPPSVIGLIIGTGPFIYGLTGVVAGIIVDRFGQKKVMICSLFLSSICLFIFFFKNNAAWYLIINALIGSTRTFFDISTKSYGIIKLTLQERRVSFSLRFMVVNSAAAIGPLVGAYFATSNAIATFYLIGGIYIILGLMSIYTLSEDQYCQEDSQKHINMTELKNILFNDKLLQLLLLISTLIWILYSQIDSTLPQYLYSEFENGIKIYSVLLLINAVVCVTLQLIVSHYIKNLNEYMVSSISAILFSISYIIFAYAASSYTFFIAISILTLAEIVIVPLNELLISKIAPKNCLNTYYGVLGLGMMGLGIGPIIGGVTYQVFDAKTLFIICSISCIALIYFYRIFFTNNIT